ncbi:hypothetical protein ACFWVB_02585 [Streptomyces microflavus]|uniref:hypothetical protein n=1 Tax=Streptomyces microflavus TaxID=1919 RepID=UPI00364EA2BA
MTDTVARPYGDPLAWQHAPPSLTGAVALLLGGYGWDASTTPDGVIVIPLDDRARGLTGPVARGEDLQVLWAGARPEWHWGTAHPHAVTGGHLAQLLAHPVDGPATITAQILRVLRTGRTLP